MINEMTRYDSVDLARHIMAICKEKGCDYNNTKINKLLYIIYGSYLALFNKEIVTERPKYLPYGPVFINVFKQYDNLMPAKFEVSEELKAVIETVFLNFGNKTAGYLSAWSHAKNSPWDKIHQVKGEEWGEEIQVFDIMNYFKNFVSFKNGNRN